MRPEPQALAFGEAIFDGRLVKSWMQNHPGGAEDAVARLTERACLGHGPIRTADEELRLPLDPEVRRVIGNVGEYRNEWACRKRTGKTLPERAIEVRDKRDKHVRLGLPPVRFEQPDCRAMIEQDGELQHLHQLRAPQGPARAQHRIVEILYANARISLYNVERIEEFLEVCKLYFPRALLRPDGYIGGWGGGPVATAGVEEGEFHALHSLHIVAPGEPQIATELLKLRFCV